MSGNTTWDASGPNFRYHANRFGAYIPSGVSNMVVVDAHIEVNAALSVEVGHNIAVEARKRVMQLHRVLNLMAHVDPSQRIDLDHPQG